ncbi:MAG: hypothetical protein B7L53_00310 [Thermofilum sp. NZ13]|nr:MAG: hypothetical protein B7L53_00310 [Thermofilum sp. NZ13]
MPGPCPSRRYPRAIRLQDAVSRTCPREPTRCLRKKRRKKGLGSRSVSSMSTARASSLSASSVKPARKKRKSLDSVIL